MNASVVCSSWPDVGVSDRRPYVSDRGSPSSGTLGLPDIRALCVRISGSVGCPVGAANCWKHLADSAVSGSLDMMTMGCATKTQKRCWHSSHSDLRTRRLIHSLARCSDPKRGSSNCAFLNFWISASSEPLLPRLWTATRPGKGQDSVAFEGPMVHMPYQSRKAVSSCIV